VRLGSREYRRSQRGDGNVIDLFAANWLVIDAVYGLFVRSGHGKLQPAAGGGRPALVIPRKRTWKKNMITSILSGWLRYVKTRSLIMFFSFLIIHGVCDHFYQFRSTHFLSKSVAIR
jgi:hypothetical protein